MDQADLIWMNGELVAWEDAKVHVLTHGLHYGTGVFEGMRAYETERGTAIFRHDEHLDRLYKSAELYYMPIPYTREELRAATHELSSRRTACRPATSARSPSAAPARWASTRSTRRSTWRSPRGRGAPTSATRPSAAACARRSRAGGASARDSLIPHAKASGQYLNSVLAKIESAQGRLRGGDPARPARLRLRGHRREHLRRARRRRLHAAADGGHPRRHQPQVGHPDRRATRATRSSSATSRAPSCTSPTRSS